MTTKDSSYRVLLVDELDRVPSRVLTFSAEDGASL